MRQEWAFVFSVKKNHQLGIKVEDRDTYKFAGGMKINKLQHTHTHFLYYIFIIIIICSLVFHIVIIVIVITSCDNLKQIKQYCLFFVELSSQLVAQALFTSDCKLAFFYKSGSPYPGPQGGPWATQQPALALLSYHRSLHTRPTDTVWRPYAMHQFSN